MSWLSDQLNEAKGTHHITETIFRSFKKIYIHITTKNCWFGDVNQSFHKTYKIFQ